MSALDGNVWFAAACSCLLSSAFGFAAWGWGVSQVGANRVLVYQYLVALTGVVAGILILGGVYLARSR